MTIFNYFYFKFQLALRRGITVDSDVYLSRGYCQLKTKSKNPRNQNEILLINAIFADPHEGLQKDENSLLPFSLPSPLTSTKHAKMNFFHYFFIFLFSRGKKRQANERGSFLMKKGQNQQREVPSCFCLVLAEPY